MGCAVGGMRMGAAPSCLREFCHPSPPLPHAPSPAEVLTLYGPQLGSWPTCDRLFARLSTKLADEAKLSKELLGLQGMLDLLMACSSSSSASLGAQGRGSGAQGLR